MEEKKLSLTYREYRSEAELPRPDRELLAAARAQWVHVYAPYSHFAVGAALRLDNGELLGGANQENAAYPVCLCAERVALGAAATAHPRRRIEALAIVCKHQERVLQRPGTPCGTCRQYISEVEDRQGTGISILLAGETGPIWRFDRGKDLLPLAFSGTML